MATFSGTNGADTVTSDAVSAGVVATPPGSAPSSANDSINGGPGNDSLDGSGGNDTIDAGTGRDTVFGGDGNDSIVGRNDEDLIVGGKGNDTILADNGNDIVVWKPGDGSDSIDLGANSNTLALGGWTGPANLPKFKSGDTQTYGQWTVTGKQNSLEFKYGPTGETLDVKFNTNQDFVIPGDGFICFYAGTLIATPTGAAAVETLRPGDLVLTAEGEAKPVRFLFRQTVSTRFADPLRALPIRVRAGALGENLPVRDLLVSPAHALLVEGVLVQAGALVNGTTILREAAVPAVFTYWHVEMAGHELVLAEGVPAETFVDNADRENFDNWAEYAALVGDAPAVPEMDLPRAKSARQVPAAVRAAIAARARALLAPAAA